VDPTSLLSGAPAQTGEEILLKEALNPDRLTEADLVRMAAPENLKLLPCIREQYDQLEGACDYFQVLERENDRILEKAE